MSLLAAIVTKLKADCPTFQDRFEIARALNNPDPVTLPEGQVQRWRTVATVNDSVTRVTQLQRREIMVQFSSKLEGVDDVDHYAIARDEILTSLLGYQVGSSELPLELVGEEFVEFGDGFTITRVTFSYSEHIRS